ncbi:MAG: YigZ family protein [Candidatus Fimisoma sp.]
MKLYSTVAGEASAEQVIEKSRFITYVKPAETREEAEAFIAEIRGKHRDATHNVPAMVLGDKMQIQWASDDGEPQGTSGAPIVKMLVAAGITNVVIVVTRYFGGIKLGTGGLVRAYTSSAKLGIEAAGVCDVAQQLCLTYCLEYTHLSKVQKMAGNDFNIGDVIYTDVVQVSVNCDPEKEETVKSAINNATGGKAILKKEEKRIISILPLT